MIREVAHFFRHLPELARLSRRMSPAALYDLLIDRADRAGLADLRAELVGDLGGRVLEVGFGTGKQFPHYSDNAEVVGIEPDRDFLSITVPGRVHRMAASGMELPFVDDSFDTVVFALVLCSVPNVEKTLSEVRRVLRPGGEVRLVEHVISDDAFAAMFMHLFNPLWLVMNRQGCHMNRDPEVAVRRAGFRLTHVERFKDWVDGLPAFPIRVIRAARIG